MRLEISGRSAAITMESAPVNGIDAVWLERFHGFMDELESIEDVVVVVIRSALKVFSAGMDLKKVHELSLDADGGAQMSGIVTEFQGAFARLEMLPQVTVAEIAGAALGGGLELALACDLRIAAAEASLGLPEAAIGLIPGAGGTQRLTRLCGPAVAARLILTAERVNGKVAEELGLVHFSAPRSELTAATDELISKIKLNSPGSLREAKRLIRLAASGSPDGFREELRADERLFATEDTRARIAEFAGAATGRMN